jgi:SAM-dependent methyltransferase
MDVRPYAAFARCYDAWTTGFWEHHGRVLDRLLADARTGRALDLACGTGGGIGYLRSRGFEAVGVDLAPEMVAVARARWPDAELHVADLRALPKMGSFQVALC